MKITFVVLHYNAMEETINCVSSIRKNIDTSNYHIIVVDNASPNKTGIQLKEKYGDDSAVTVLLSEKNLGFANGNNEGIRYAKEQLHADFVCCTNNDTLLEQNDFFQSLLISYESSHAAVIGPKVILKSGEIQRLPDKLLTLTEYQHQLAECQKVLNHDLIQSIKEELYGFKVVRSLSNWKHRVIGDAPSVQVNYDDYYEKKHTDVILHGCCLIFTPAFFEELSGFCPDTFLYHEEDLLYIDVMEKGLHTLYEPGLQMRHLEDASTNTIVKTSREKREFLAKHKSQSLRVLIDRLKEIKVE